MCPRFYTDGKSRCPGCGGADFSTTRPSCGALSCCKRNGLEFCWQCGDFPCPKYDGADKSDSFITHKNQFRDMGRARRESLDVYIAVLEEKMEILKLLLERYNDGRMKSFYCLAVNLMEIGDIRAVMTKIKEESQPKDSVAERAALASRLFRSAAHKLGIELALRKKSPELM